MFCIALAISGVGNNRGQHSIGHGGNYYFTPSEGQFSASKNQHNGATIEFSNGIDHWKLDFAAPGGAPLFVGTYDKATRYSNFQSPTTLALDVAADGRKFNELIGSFTVKEIA